MRYMAIAFCATLAGLTACGDDDKGSPNNPGGVELQSRNDAIDDITDAVCDRYEECNVFGKDEWFSSKEECQTEVRNRFDDTWSVEDCGGERVAEAEFNSCKSRAQTIACDQNILDAGAFLVECNADKVCR